MAGLYDPSIFQPENWEQAERGERLYALQQYENWAAEQQGRDPRILSTDGDFSPDENGNEQGGYLGHDGVLYINPSLVTDQETAEGIEAPSVNEALFCVGHEGVHATQEDYINGNIADEKRHALFCQENDTRLADGELIENCLTTSEDYYKDHYNQMPTEETANIASANLGERFLKEQVYPNDEEEGNNAASSFRDYSKRYLDNDNMPTLASEADETQSTAHDNRPTETLENTANQANLPATDQSNTQGNEQAQNEDNSMHVQ